MEMVLFIIFFLVDLSAKKSSFKKIAPFRAFLSPCHWRRTTQRCIDIFLPFGNKNFKKEKKNQLFSFNWIFKKNIFSVIRFYKFFFFSLLLMFHGLSNDNQYCWYNFLLYKRINTFLYFPYKQFIISVYEVQFFFSLQIMSKYLLCVLL